MEVLMAPETAYVIDFDGTVTTRDITTELGLFFGGAKFVEIDQSYQAKQIPIKSWLQAEVTLLPADLEKLKHKALEWAEIRPGFKTFLQKARAKNNPVIIASDGLGFYIEPILKQFDLLGEVDQLYRNDTFINDRGLLEISNPHAHPTCVVCGNCKARIVLQQKTADRPVIYIGDGSNDRFGASWADLIFAREELALNCEKHNLSYSPWGDFYDIINVTEPELTDREAEALCCPQGAGVKEQ
jgi:2-hydroxy-3-keto-5-methylthiopentenyl-1-phosphate phosphatase